MHHSSDFSCVTVGNPCNFLCENVAKAHISVFGRFIFSWIVKVVVFLLIVFTSFWQIYRQIHCAQLPLLKNIFKYTHLAALTQSEQLSSFDWNLRKLGNSFLRNLPEMLKPSHILSIFVQKLMQTFTLVSQIATAHVKVLAKLLRMVFLVPLLKKWSTLFHQWRLLFEHVCLIWWMIVVLSLSFARAPPLLLVLIVVVIHATTHRQLLRRMVVVAIIGGEEPALDAVLAGRSLLLAVRSHKEWLDLNVFLPIYRSMFI